MTQHERSKREVTAETPLGDVLDFMKILWGLDHNLQRVSKRMAATLGVTGPQRLVLRIVSLFPDIAAGGLASILRLHPSSVTVLLNRLEADGFLSRRQDPGDGRRVKLRITARGQRILGRTEGTVESAMRGALGQFPAEKLQAASEVLSAIATELERSTPAEVPGEGEAAPASSTREENPRRRKSKG